jgi:hypothetical protein
MMTTTEVAAIQIPLRPQPGEVWFTINLNLVEDVPALYALVRSLGYAPTLAYRQTKAGMEIHLLLYHEQRPILETPVWDEFEQSMYALSDVIHTDAVHLLCGLTKIAV